ncbi:MAG: hypothetical protein ABL932_09720 [Terricaulis sp.]
MDITALLHQAVAEEYDSKQTSDAPVILALCALYWFDGAGQLPIGRKPSTKRKRAPRPDCYAMVEKLHGRPLPVGFSRETFREALSILRDDKARDVFRYEFRLTLPKREAAHEY